MKSTVSAILFDFDGTLADTAPDLAGAVNEMLADRGLSPVSFEMLRKMASQGARGLLKVAFNVDREDAQFEALRVEFLDRYEARMTSQSSLFKGISSLLAWLDVQALPWGIVTNKATRFALPIIEKFGLSSHINVCGDTTAYSKPHPEPLLYAARTLKVKPAECIYVGDDLRDVQAAKAAGMRSIVAAFGYLGEEDQLEDWGADYIIQQPKEIVQLIIQLSTGRKFKSAAAEEV